MDHGTPIIKLLLLVTIIVMSLDLQHLLTKPVAQSIIVLMLPIPIIDHS